MAVRHTGATNDVLAYLRENPDTIIPYPEIERALKIPDYTVSNSVGNLIRQGLPITRPIRGQVIYSTGPVEPVAKNRASEVYEYVGTSGKYTIVRDTDNVLYVLAPLEKVFDNGL